MHTVSLISGAPVELHHGSWHLSSFACYAAGVLALSGVIGCSQITNEPTSETVKSAQPDPAVISPVPGIKAKCFDADTNVPHTLIEPLAEIIDKHITQRTYNTDRDTYSVDVHYFLGTPAIVQHEPTPPDNFPAYTPGESPFADNLFFNGHLISVMAMDGDRWAVTLHGEMDAHHYYGGGQWEIQADATLDPVTCNATLERLVAGPDQIVLYPE